MSKRRRLPDLGNVTQRHITLAQTLLHANAMAAAVQEAQSGRPKSRGEEFRAIAEQACGVMIGSWAKWSTYVPVYYALMHVLIATGEATEISNDAIDVLLANKKLRKRFRDFRNTMLHVASPNDPRLQAFVSDIAENDSWCNAIRDEYASVVRAHFTRP